MHKIAIGLAGTLLFLLATPSLQAQTAAEVAAAQQAYEREVAACNNGNLPAPTRDACVRAAGVVLDRIRGANPVDVPLTTPDGRATVIAPEGSSPPAGDRPPVSVAPPSGAAGTITTPDGRATIVRP